MNLIEGVKVKPLRVHTDERGHLMELMRNDEDFFNKFGQIYVTTCRPGVVKAWHLHTKQEDNFFCINGSIKLGLYDDRVDSRTRYDYNMFVLGDWAPLAVKIPAGVFHGFKCISQHEATILNCCTEVYNKDNPDEIRKPWEFVRIFNWEIENG